jgi:calcyphosin
VVDFDELIQAIKGDMNSTRKEIVKKAFIKMDENQNGVLEINDIRQSYNASNHPDVKSGNRTEDEVLQEFLETFEAHMSMSKSDALSKKGDGKVTFNEFMDYYSNINASIDDDEYFVLMITNAWNLDNKSYGKGWGAEY